MIGATNESDSDERHPWDEVLLLLAHAIAAVGQARVSETPLADLGTVQERCRAAEAEIETLRREIEGRETRPG